MKHIPNRKCICCKKIKNKNELIRIAMVDSSECVVDFEKKYSGRGAYICKDEKCADLLVKKNALCMAFKQKISPKAHENLRKELLF